MGIDFRKQIRGSIQVRCSSW